MATPLTSIPRSRPDAAPIVALSSGILLASLGTSLANALLPAIGA